MSQDENDSQKLTAEEISLEQTDAMSPKEIAPQEIENMIEESNRKISQHGVVQQQSTAIATTMQMLQSAMERGADIAQCEMIIALQERIEANEAKKAFDYAMSAFRGEPITIEKDSQVHFKNKSGGFTSYKHSTLATVVDAAIPAMSKYGLSHRWRPEQGEGGRITVTCIITHALGHREETSLSASPDETGNKNNIQAIGSTINYLERYTFMAATGLAAKDQDNDGNSPGEAKPKWECVTEYQLKELKKLIKESGTDLELFIEWCNVEKLEHVPEYNFTACVDMLNRKINANKKPGEEA